MNRVAWRAPQTLALVLFVGALATAAFFYWSWREASDKVSELQTTTAQLRDRVDQKERKLQERKDILDDQRAELESRGAELESLRSEVQNLAEDLQAKEQRIESLTSCRLPDPVAIRQSIRGITQDSIGRSPTSNELDTLVSEYMALSRRRCDELNNGNTFDVDARFIRRFEQFFSEELVARRAAEAAEAIDDIIRGPGLR